MTILIVDDNQVNRYVMEQILKDAHYENIISLESAQALFEFLDSRNSYQLNDISVILLDIMMPSIDGIEACQVIKKDPNFKDIPIIFVSALEDKQKLSEALDIGGSDYITKPINRVEILARIRVAIRLKEELDRQKNQRKKFQNELNLASRVQRSLLTPNIIRQNIAITSSYLPSTNLAGDMYYWNQIDEYRYSVMILDMMGHGISASLVCMYIYSVLQEAVEKLKCPELVITELNRYMNILESEEENIFYYFTGIYLIIDTKNKIIEYVNAGHPSGYALVDEKETVEITQTTSAVGFVKNMDINKGFIRYDSNIQLVLYTDGVLEALGDCEFESEEKIKKAASKTWSHKEQPIEYLINPQLFKKHSDDMCILLIQAKA